MSVVFFLLFISSLTGRELLLPICCKIEFLLSPVTSRKTSSTVSSKSNVEVILHLLKIFTSFATNPKLPLFMASVSGNKDAMWPSSPLKPAETTSLTALLFAEICDQAGLPNGVVNIITGDGTTGSLIVNHQDINKIAFTGSTQVGKLIQKSLAGREVGLTLELGGKAANIVYEDAAIDQAVEGVVNGIFFNQGHVETHVTAPKTVLKLQKAVRSGDISDWHIYLETLEDRVDVQLRDMFSLPETINNNKIAKEEILKEIYKKFTVSSMSLGALSEEAHQALAIATTTTLSAAAASITAMYTSMISGKPDVSMTLNGALAGLVAITAEPLTPSPLFAILVGSIGSLIMYIVKKIKKNYLY